MRATFLRSEDDDHELEHSNGPFWEALIGHVRADGFARAPETVVDVGSHRGGLLELIIERWGARVVYGIEPVATLRKRALLRLRGQAKEVHMLAPDEWARVPSRQVDLALVVESLHFIEDLAGLFDEIGRVLTDGGRAYLVLGCHGENPVWPSWKRQLEEMGHAAFTHEPMAILAAGAERGLLPSVRRLREQGWVTHDPRDPTFTFDSVKQMFDHHFEHKLLFRFIRR